MISQKAWNTFEKFHTIIPGVKRGIEVKSNGIERLHSKIIAEISPNIEKEVGFQMQETYRTPNRCDQRRISPRYVIVRMSKIQRKEITLKVIGGKNNSHAKAEITELPQTF